VDDAASRPPRPRARTGAGTCVLGQPGAGHGLQVDQEEVKPHKVRCKLNAAIGVSRTALVNGPDPFSKQRAITPVIIPNLHDESLPDSAHGRRPA
jgi:hypothetical protein